jgi:SP family arabinose:H+ symporter-like MFS transporter
MGIIGPLMSIMLSIGLTLAFSFSFFLPIEDFSQSSNDLWKFMFMVPAIAAVYQACFFWLWVKLDTPLYYLRSKDYDKYKLVLLTIVNENDIPDEEMFRTSAYEIMQSRDETSFKGLICDKSKSKMLRIGVILAVFQQFSGINAVIFYSFLIYKEIGLSVLEARIFNVSIGLTYLLSSIFTIVILKYVGRKTSLLYGHSLICVVLVIMGLVSQFASQLHYLLAALLIIYIILFNFGLSATLWSYVSEIQTERAISLSISSNYLANIVINYVFPIALTLIDIYYIFYFFGLCMLFAAIYIKFDTIETSEKSKIKFEIDFNIDKNGISENQSLGNNHNIEK